MGDLVIKERLTQLIQKGVHFEISQDKLVVKGNLGALENEDKQFLKANKPAIISFIENQVQEIPAIKKVKDTIAKPLSFSQQSLWLLDKINSGSSHYNITSAFKLKGKLNTVALEKTFLNILERHESLRSYFIMNDKEEPIQKLNSVTEFDIHIESLDATLNADEQIEKCIEEEKHYIFDLTKDILLRVRVLQVQEEEHILIVNMHHIASDGWSMGILIKEFSTLYTNYIKDGEFSLPELKVQYSDYAHWQRNWLKGNVLKKYTNYWKNQLADLPTIHNLPIDKPRPNLQSFNGSIHTSTINKETASLLQDICKEESASLFMGLHAAFSTLLARYSNEKDIVIGSPIANREQAETADLVGFFMNLLVLRSDLSKNQSFRELVKQSKEVLEGAYEHQQMPFDKLVEELKVKRSLSHSPLFQVALSLQNNQRGELSMSDLTMEAVSYEKGNSSKYDLSLAVSESEEGLQLSWEYNTDLFNSDTITKMADHFEVLFSSLLQQPEENVFKVAMVTENNKAALLEGVVQTLEENDAAVISFDNAVSKYANKTAVVCNDVELTYEAFNNKVNEIANQLLKKGVQAGDKVGVCLIRNSELVATLFACFRIGATYIPLDPIYPAERIQQIIEDAAPKRIITFNALAELYLGSVSAETTICLDKIEAGYLDTTPVASKYNAATTAYIIFTSGTTGRPKGIEVSQENVTNLLKGFDLSFGETEEQKWLAQTSMNFDISVLELIWTISRGKTMVFQQSSPVKLLSHDRLETSKKLDFSVMFFGADNAKERKYDLLLETAKYADEHNFSAIWTPERHFGEFGGAFPSPAVLGGALAAITNRLSIRSGSVVLPLHDPIRVAEEWSLIDNLSNGRVGMSIASGWHPNDYVFYNSDYENRHQQMREKIGELKLLWDGTPITRKNGVGNETEIQIRPNPIQRDLPLWITAARSPETFRYAGEIGANILTHMLGQSLEILEENIAIYHKSLRENGFKVEDKTVSLMLHTYINDSEDTALAISEKPFKSYLGSSMKLIEPMIKQLGLDADIEPGELVDIVYKKFSQNNTLIGSPESCQKVLHSVQAIGVTEIACLVDFGVDKDNVLAGLEKIEATQKRYHAYSELTDLLNIENQETELALIDKHNITHVQMTPSQSKLMVDLYKQQPNNQLSSVSNWFIGGEAISKTLVNELSTIANCGIYNMYGPTETTVWSAWRKMNTNDVAIGEPILNTKLLLLNEFGQEVPLGVIGELYIGGLGVAKGYYNNDTLTNERFVNVEGLGRCYKTGDLMKQHADGTFEFVARKDNQIKINGYRVELEDIESTIGKVHGIKDNKVLPFKENSVAYLSAYVQKDSVVYGDFTDLPVEKQAKPFHFPDGSVIYNQTDRQLGVLYQEVIKEGVYFKYGISVPENGLILDVGANVGGFSIDASQRHPSATIVAFEPIPQTFSSLKKNYEHRQIKGRVLNYGISNKQEKATFFYYPQMSGMSGRFSDKETIIDAVGQYIRHGKETLTEDGKYLAGENREIVRSYYKDMDSPEGLSSDVKDYLSSLYLTEEVECKLTTISDVIDEMQIEAVDLLKVDIEKSECLALEGIREEHWSMIKHLALEVDGDGNLNIIRDLLEEKGYTVNVDELIMSDTTAETEENTYMLYASNLEHGKGSNEKAFEIIQPQASETIIRDTLKKALPEYMNPKNIVFVPEIPLMGNGKVNIKELKEIKPAQMQVADKVTELTDETELAIYRIWKEVLKKEDIPHHISIFEAGGNSIEVVLLHERMQSEFNIIFSLIELFRNPTIVQQAKLVQNADGTKIGEESLKKATDKGASRRKARMNN